MPLSDLSDLTGQFMTRPLQAIGCPFSSRTSSPGDATSSRPGTASLTNAETIYISGSGWSAGCSAQLASYCDTFKHPQYGQRAARSGSPSTAPARCTKSGTAACSWLCSESTVFTATRATTPLGANDEVMPSALMTAMTCWVRFTNFIWILSFLPR